ncbi:DUF998 domain-containing protein [Mycobacterium sp.]|uniref:DUF998 domain-containing protein n=1 Tax=Mycobacterium sp. TaxID=1785 RepID=UPI002F41274D
MVAVVQNTLGESDFRNNSALANRVRDQLRTVMVARHLAAVAWLTAGLAYVTLEAIAAHAFRPDYSYANNLISDLGIPSGNSPLAWLMNTAFSVQGTLFLVGAILTVRAIGTRKARVFLTLAGANAVGNVLIAIFHSGPSPAAWVHAVGAVLAIGGGNAAILAGSSVISGPRWYRRVSVGLGAFGLVSFVLFAIGVLPVGVWERCSVYSITAWQLFTGTWLFTRRPTVWRDRARRA